MFSPFLFFILMFDVPVCALVLCPVGFIEVINFVYAGMYRCICARRTVASVLLSHSEQTH
jgi:hypothetical protein